jgi:hypothetical protein
MPCLPTACFSTADKIQNRMISHTEPSISTTGLKGYALNNPNSPVHIFPGTKYKQDLAICRSSLLAYSHDDEPALIFWA